MTILRLLAGVCTLYPPLSGSSPDCSTAQHSTHQATPRHELIAQETDRYQQSTRGTPICYIYI